MEGPQVKNQRPKLRVQTKFKDSKVIIHQDANVSTKGTSEKQATEAPTNNTTSQVSHLIPQLNLSPHRRHDLRNQSDWTLYKVVGGKFQVDPQTPIAMKPSTVREYFP